MVPPLDGVLRERTVVWPETAFLSKGVQMRWMIRATLSLVCLGLGTTSGFGQALTPFSAPAPPVKHAPDAFGTVGDTYVDIGEWQFTTPDSSWLYGDTNGNQPLKFSKQGGLFLNAPVHVPTGAILDYLEFDYCDDNATEDINVGLYNLDNLNNVIFLLGSVGSTGQPGCTSGTFNVGQYGIAADNVNQRLILQVHFGANADSSTRFAGAKLGYRLQVSPAPVSPTFGDVPTSDPGFQYIEALVASGVTAGCGGGNYCPDATLTRRQMAVFLAKALGLYWPN